MFRGAPVGASATMAFEKGEGAILNLERRSSIYSYLPLEEQTLLREYMERNYMKWLKDRAFLKPHELILVTGTTMTHNWEAAAFKASSSSLQVKLSVEMPPTPEGGIKIMWSRRPEDRCGFESGHKHLQDIRDGQVSASPNNPFDTCCQRCSPPPLNQCIFLHGWRVIETRRLRKVFARVVPVMGKDTLMQRLKFEIKNLIVSHPSDSEIQVDSKDNTLNSGSESECNRGLIDFKDIGTASDEEEEDNPVSFHAIGLEFLYSLTPY